MAIAQGKQRKALAPVHTAAAIPAVAGAYVLAIDMAEPLMVAVGNRLSWALPAGRYLYCGSAKGSGGLRARIARHMRRGKVMHWHVDQLTERAAAIGVWIFPGGEECRLAARLTRIATPIHGFGNTDCLRCAAHLFAWPTTRPLRL